jgi:hypothetical protein
MTLAIRYELHRSEDFLLYLWNSYWMANECGGRGAFDKVIDCEGRQAPERSSHRQSPEVS